MIRNDQKMKAAMKTNLCFDRQNVCEKTLVHYIWLKKLNFHEMDFWRRIANFKTFNYLLENGTIVETPIIYQFYYNGLIYLRIVLPIYFE
jgi:hypothetical protein